MRTTRLSIIVLLSVLIFASCKNKGKSEISENENSKDQLTIIDGIVLGQSADSLFASYQTLGISKREFITGDLFSSMSEVNSNIYNQYFTKIFDFSEFKNQDTKLSHYGILYPNSLRGTDKIVCMEVILVTATAPSYENNPAIFTEIQNNLCIKQEINELVIREITKLYETKYGTPRRDTSENTRVFVFENGKPKVYSAGAPGELLIWENETMEIHFYTGLKSTNTFFNNNLMIYSPLQVSIDDARGMTFDNSKGFYGCYSYPYIEYVLKNNIVEKMNLNDPKI
jgi:hypothetical protein